MPNNEDGVDILQKANSVSVILSSKEREDKDLEEEKKSSKTADFVISPICGPQSISVQVHLENTGDSGEARHRVGVQLCRKSNMRDARFEWQWWRDAALGRMEGLRRWQENHGMRSVDLHTTESTIASGTRIVKSAVAGVGMEMCVWSGWEPFRFRQCRLELESEKLLVQFDVKMMAHGLQVRKKDVITHHARAVAEKSFCRYAEARRESLQEGSLVVS